MKRATAWALMSLVSEGFWKKYSNCFYLASTQHFTNQSGSLTKVLRLTLVKETLWQCSNSQNKVEKPQNLSLWDFTLLLFKSVINQLFFSVCVCFENIFTILRFPATELGIQLKHYICERTWNRLCWEILILRLYDI